MLQSGGLSADQYGALENMRRSGGQFGDIYGAAQQVGGQAGQQYSDIYNQASGQDNPYLLQQLGAQDRRIADKLNASMSGAGRYGSGQHTDVLGRTLAEASYPVLAQDYARRQQERLAAAGGGLQAGLGSLAAQQNATSGGLQAWRDMLQGYAGGQNVAGEWARTVPELDEAQYTPSEKVQQFGDFYQSRAAEDLANQIARYNAEQSYPWEQLARYQGIIAGTGQLGGTKVTTTTPARGSLLQRVGGGALAGAGAGSMLGPWGALAGGAAGGLMGLMG